MFFGGRLFLKFDSTLNELDPNFHLVSIGLRQIQSVFLPKSSNLQNKVFTDIQSVFLSTDTHFYFSFHDFWGGLFSFGGLFPVLGQKPTSKLLKACYFAYCSGQWGGGGYSTICPPSYATGWKDARCSQSIFHTTSLR